MIIVGIYNDKPCNLVSHMDKQPHYIRINMLVGKLINCIAVLFER